MGFYSLPFAELIVLILYFSNNETVNWNNTVLDKAIPGQFLSPVEKLQTFGSNLKTPSCRNLSGRKISGSGKFASSRMIAAKNPLKRFRKYGWFFSTKIYSTKPHFLTIKHLLIKNIFFKKSSFFNQRYLIWNVGFVKKIYVV